MGGGKARRGEGGRREKGGERLRLGRVVRQRGRVKVVRERREGEQGGRVGEEVKGWKNVGILQQERMV